jgi:uncharacterized protein
MRLNHIILSLTVCLSVVALTATAQSKHKLTLLGRAYGDSIVLRWAPGSAVAWEAANKSGYQIERFVLMKAGELQVNPQGQVLTPSPLAPWDMKRWERIVKSDKYAALAAQALFGKTFQLSTGRMGDASQIYQKVKESDARYSMALFAADVSPSVAEASALRFTDRSVKPGEKYVYKIYTMSKSITIDTAFCYISADDNAELPKPFDVKGSYVSGNAVITWDKTYIQDIYTAFFVERSDDNGASFKRVNDLPLVNTYAGETSPDRAIYTDSIPSLDKKFFYRIRGINAFAEVGPPSDTVSVKGLVSADRTPVITKAVAENNDKVRITWDFPKSAEKTIHEFQVERAAKASGNYSVLKKGIDVKERQFTDLSPLVNGYYRVRAIGLHKSEKVSLAHLVQLIDSIPPSPPRGLAGSMDSTGVVTLHWNSNKEHDLKGYRIYRANFTSDEFYQVTTSPVADTIFRDRVNLKTLTKSLFYKIVAVDHNFNPSDFSFILELQRHDKIPPVPPIFTNYQAGTDGIRLRWQPSSSDDVTETKLFRRMKSQALWKPIASFTANDTTTGFVDKDLKPNKFYEYTLVAYDAAKNESAPQPPVTLQFIDDGVRPAIRDLAATANRQDKSIRLSWTYDITAAKFNIYRQIGEGALTLYKTVSGSEKNFTDKALRVNTTYAYRVKAVTADGGESPITELITVQY